MVLFSLLLQLQGLFNAGVLHPSGPEECPPNIKDENRPRHHTQHIRNPVRRPFCPSVRSNGTHSRVAGDAFLGIQGKFIEALRTSFCGMELFLPD